MTRQEMIAVAHQCLLNGPSPLLRYTPGGRRAEAEGVVFNCWGPHGPALNKAVVVGPAPPFRRVLALADAFFGSESGGFGVVVEADAGNPVEAELRAAGWQVFEDEPALVLPTFSGQLPPVPTGLEIRRVIDNTGRRDLGHVLARGFGAPTAEGMVELSPEAYEDLVPSLECASDPEVALLVGYLDGVPASSAFLFIVGQIAGITGVATVPEYRRRGLAEALTWAAIREGAARGCTCAALAGLGASFELYRKMGFVHVCNHRAYQRPAESVS
ncbi:MAG: GNAT family N-acetyltransferase [Gemmataceae bacterium]